MTNREKILEIRRLSNELMLSRINDYLTSEKMAEHCGVSLNVLSYALQLARQEFTDKDFDFPFDQ